MIETTLPFIEPNDLLGIAYAKLIRGTCRRVLNGRNVEGSIKDLRDALECFLGDKGYPPSPRHTVTTVRELVISYILLGEPDSALEIINKIEKLIANEPKDGKFNPFSKLQKDRTSTGKHNKWLSQVPALKSRIFRKRAKILREKAEIDFIAGDRKNFLKKMSDAEIQLQKAIVFGRDAVKRASSNNPQNYADVLLVLGEAYFYDHNNSEAEKCFLKAKEVNKNSTVRQNPHENFEITAICLLYLGQIHLITNQFPTAFEYFAEFLAIRDNLHNTWVEELYKNSTRFLITIDMSQVQRDITNPSNSLKRLRIYENHLIKAICEKFDGYGNQRKTAKHLEIDKSIVTRRLKELIN